VDRRDRAVVAVLAVLLVALGVAIGFPGSRIGAGDEQTPGPSLPGPVTYREGVVGQVASVTPLTARTRAERTLVGLVFSGLVRPGPGTTFQPDLASSWSVDETGKTWTFRIREDAVWHDGTPVTAADVVFTARALRNREVPGPLAASWAEVTAAATGPRTVTLTLETPLGGFLAAATQPLLPAHLLSDVAIGDLASDPFGMAPIGTGAFALVEMDDAHAVLEPAALLEPVQEETEAPIPTDSLASQGPVATPDRAVPYLDRIEIRFFDDADALVAAFEDGELDGVAGLPGSSASGLAGDADARLLRYPTTTLSTVVLNLRPSHPELRVPAVRRGLLAAVDRDALVRDSLGGGALRADAMVPPASWAFDATVSPSVPFDAAAAATAFAAAGWTKVEGGLAAPGATTPYQLDVLAVPAEVSPSANAVANDVAEAWRAIGLTVTVTETPAAELSTRLGEGTFTAAVVDVAFGLEPDLYPLLASSQVLAPGSNYAGLQDPALDAPRLLDDPGDRFWDVLAWRLAADR
jgi:peptide/nickel transport system substrate-binding protein